MLTRNKEMERSAEVLKGYFENNTSIAPENSTRSMHDEIVRDNSCINAIQWLMEQEAEMQFKTVDNKFTVIDSDTVPAVIDASFASAIARGESDWRALQKKSVSIRRCMIRKWKLKKIAGSTDEEEVADGVYQWTLEYDDFLGFMRGVLNLT